MEKRYNVISFTTDEVVKGKGDNHRVKIDENLDQYDSIYSIYDYINNFNTYCKNIPDGIKGELIRKKTTVDFMNFTPSINGLQFICSIKFLELLNKLNIEKNEYFAKPIDIKGFNIPFYLFYVPLHSFDFIDFSKSIIYKGFLDVKENRKYINIDNYNEFKESGITTFEKVVIQDSLYNNDIISIQGISKCAFSERLYNACLESKLIGLEIDQNDELEVLFPES